MTMNTTTFDTGLLPGNSSTFTFSFSPMVIFAASEIEVYHVVIATGVETLVSEGTGATDYSVSTIAAAGATGSITYPADSSTPIPSTEAILIKRKLPQTQTTDLQNQGGYFPETLEKRFDRITMMVQAMQEELDRSLKLPITAPATFASVEINPDGLLTASQFLKINSTATGFTVAGISSGTAATASDATPQPGHVTSGSAGSGTDFSRDDHRHFIPATIPRLATNNIWSETQVFRADGEVASLAALDLTGTPGNMFDITGTNAITSIVTMGVGVLIFLQFDAALTLTHHATNLKLPGGNNIVTQAGDIAVLYEYASADWRLVSFTHGLTSNGRMPSPDYESSETSLDNDAQITFAHGLANIPHKVEVLLRANTATAQGWADNEEGLFPPQWSGAVADDNVSVTFDGTNVYITQGNAIQLIDHSSFNAETITQTEYHWVVRCWA